MSKKKVVKKTLNKKPQKSLKNIIKQTYLDNFHLIKDLDGYRTAMIAAGHQQTTLNVVDEETAMVLKELLSRQDENMVTRTFTSTTFDDIVAFPKYPVNKPGFHVVGKTNDVDLNEQVIKSFEKNIPEVENLNLLSSKDLPGVLKLLNAEDNTLPIENIDQDLPLENWLNMNNLETKKGRNIIREGLKLIKKPNNIEFTKNDKFNKILPYKNDLENDPCTMPTNRDKVNNSNKLFDELADKVGQITKEYWQAKHKLVLINRFMDEFYAGKQFEELEPLETPLDFNQQLQKAVDLIDGEDSEYKKSVLRKIRPDKYK